MLTFELQRGKNSKYPDQLEIYLDSEGLESLLAQLRFLREGRTDHVHLMSESWGGTHLDDHPQRANSVMVHHVRIQMCPSAGTLPKRVSEESR